MAHTRSRKRSRRRILRREAPSIVPVLADEAHFARMRTYGSFAFDDHRSYLRQLEGLLRSLTADHVHTRLALFDAVDYELFCQEQALDPDTAASRSRYVAEVAAAGTTVPYGGQTLGRLLPELRDAHACRLTWQTGVEILARVGSCGRCGSDIGRAAFDRAARAVSAVLDAAGSGVHHLVASVAVAGSPLVTSLDVRRTGEGAFDAHESAVLALTTALAAGIATGSDGGLVLRTETGGPRAEAGEATTAAVGTGGEKHAVRDVVRGWQLDASACWLRPLSAAEVFAAYCTDPATKEPVAPEPGVEHAPGHDLPHPGGELHC
ncbi:hypothetical protein G4Z16_30605 [Streptomyces bathyalis]|uniref:Uncharacterized protein n=1 Tax=Streptomyces bathyalis TaxID=2710756 RepID=A0A7T1TBR1_9ACTN|nr:hypothetical protein [Streptomyces bathyalis]QPP10052.1 hypothetical protein G4Z16_30605 [Streptomyces bathyalis]